VNVSRRALIIALLLAVIAAGVYAGYRVVFAPGKPQGSMPIPQAALATQAAKVQAEEAARALKESRKEWDRKGVKVVHEAVQSARALSGDAIANGLNDQLARFRGGQILPAGDVDP
jgi:hypothetical protein